jgi:hypothetical protein
MYLCVGTEPSRAGQSSDSEIPECCCPHPGVKWFSGVLTFELFGVCLSSHSPFLTGMGFVAATAVVPD